MDEKPIDNDMMLIIIDGVPTDRITRGDLTPKKLRELLIKHKDLRFQIEASNDMLRLLESYKNPHGNCPHSKVFSGRANYKSPPEPHNFEWICRFCYAAGYQDQIVSGHKNPEDDDYVDRDLWDLLKPLARHD